MTDKTTPRPWRAVENSDDQIFIGREGNDFFSLEVLGDWPVPMRAFAAKVVTSLNAHDALVEAVSELLAAHQRADPHPEILCSNCALARRVLQKAGVR